MTADGTEPARTRSFKELVQELVAADSVYGAALLREAVNLVLVDDVATGTAIPRDYADLAHPHQA